MATVTLSKNDVSKLQRDKVRDAESVLQRVSKFEVQQDISRFSEAFEESELKKVLDSFNIVITRELEAIRALVQAQDPAGKSARFQLEINKLTDAIDEKQSDEFLKKAKKALEFILSK